MTFEHNGAQYRIVFQRKHVLPALPHTKPSTTTRMETQAQLFQVLETIRNGRHDYKELGRATVRGYFKDEVSRETGRRKALQRLSPFLAPELRPLMWKAYLNRRLDFRPKEPKASE